NEPPRPPGAALRPRTLAARQRRPAPQRRAERVRPPDRAARRAHRRVPLGPRRARRARRPAPAARQRSRRPQEPQAARAARAPPPARGGRAVSTTQQMLDYLRDQYLHEQDRAIAAEQRAYKLANEVERLNYLQRRSVVKEHQ